jgi:hypothetical protein
MPRGTSNYALEHDESGRPMLAQTAPAGRTCPLCGAALLIYNLDGNGLCWPCQKRGDEPLTMEQLAQVFEAVCGALSAPLLEEAST